MLRDYQQNIAKEGLAILKQYGIVYLALEMRLGKSLTSMVIADGFGAKSVLFVTKKKAIASIEKDKATLKPSFAMLVINYESLHHIQPGKYDLIIIDEAHCIGAFPVPSKATKTLKEICCSKPVIFLSGTPTPESYSQLYHQFWVSDNTPFTGYTNFYKWAKEFVYVKQRMFNGLTVNDYSNANKLKVDKYTKHLFISYTQKQAGFTEEIEEQVLKVPMKAPTYFLAEKLRKDRLFIGRQGEEVLADTAVKLQQKLHQVYSGSVIAEKQDEPIIFDDSKARFIAYQFKGKKIAIFYIFRAELKMIEQVFKGRTTDSPELFNSREDLVFVSQIRSGSMGINLATADALIFYNIHFSNVLYHQARARLQDKNRTKPCLLYWIFAENGIEELIYERVKNKQDYVLSYFIKDFNIHERAGHTKQD